jgi:hypothetical protein
MIIHQMTMNLYHFTPPSPHPVAAEMTKADLTFELEGSFEKLSDLYQFYCSESRIRSQLAYLRP